MDKWFDYGKGMRRALMFGSSGLELAIAVALGWYLGDKLDGRFETAPWLMLTGVLLGTAAGVLSLLRTLKKVEEESK